VHEFSENANDSEPGLKGDQIGRILAFWVIALFAQFFCYSSSPFWGQSMCIYFDKKMSWAAFWAICSQTHLVALPQFSQKTDALQIDEKKTSFP
jgi:hypothetical protein